MTKWDLFSLSEDDAGVWECEGTQLELPDLFAKITDLVVHIEKPVALRIER